MKNKIEALKERYVRAKTDEEYEVIREELRTLCDEDTSAVAQTALQCIKETNAAIIREKGKKNGKTVHCPHAHRESRRHHTAYVAYS